MEQIICQNLSIGYNKVAIQEDINLCIKQADFLCIIGSNGIGKTTFMKTLLGLISPLSGSIKRAKEVKFNTFSYLPQQTQRQKDFPASVWEVALSGHIARHGLRPFYTKEEKAKTMQLLEKIGIDSLKNTSYSKISGGQQQKVLLARALSASSELIFLDEPTSALDPETTHEMYRLFEQLNNEGITFVLISHDIQNALNYANKIVLFDENVQCFDKEHYLEKYCSCVVHTKGDALL